MRLECQISLKSLPLNLLAESSPEQKVMHQHGGEDRVKVVVIAQWSSTGCHCIFKTFHRCFVNIYQYGFKSPARNGSSRTVRRRDVSAMVVANVLGEKMCAFEILWRLDYKGCLLHECFSFHPDGQCSFPFVSAWGILECTQKLSLDSIYCLIFHVGIILIAFHS